MSKYGQIILFKEHRIILCRKETGHLKRWVEKYVQLASRGSSQADNDLVMDELEEDTEYIRGEDEIQDMNHRTRQQYTKRYLSELAWCLECDRQVGMGAVRTYSHVDSTSTDITTAANGTEEGGDKAQNSGRDGSTDSDLPYHFANMEDRVGAICS